MTIPDHLRGQTVYVDSHILICAVETPVQFQENLANRLSGLFEDVRAGLTRLLTSHLTISEVLVLPFRESDFPLEQTYRRMLRGTPHFRIAPISPGVLEKAAALRARYPGLKLADAIHLATAIDFACDRFLTADKHLRQCERKIPIALLDE